MRQMGIFSWADGWGSLSRGYGSRKHGKISIKKRESPDMVYLKDKETLTIF